MLKKFLKDETGLELSEYAVAAALIAIAAAGVSRLWATSSASKSTSSVVTSLRASEPRGQQTVSMFLVSTFLLVPLAAVIAYYDVRYRRIPNAFVLAAFSGGCPDERDPGRMAGHLFEPRWLPARVCPDVHAPRVRSDGRGRRQTFRRDWGGYRRASWSCPLS